MVKVILFLTLWVAGAILVKKLVKQGKIKKFDKGWTGPILLGVVAAGIVGTILVKIIEGLFS